jgi:hypothetical protein
MTSQGTLGEVDNRTPELSALDEVVFVNSYRCLKGGRKWPTQGASGTDSRCPDCDAVAYLYLSQEMKPVPPHDDGNKVASDISKSTSPDVGEAQGPISGLRWAIVNKMKTCLDIGLALACFCLWSVLVVSVVAISVLLVRHRRKRDREMVPPAQL